MKPFMSICTIVVFAVAAAPAAAQYTQPLRVSSISKTVQAGKSGHVTVHVDESVKRCSLVLARKSKTAARRSASATRARMSWRWRVPAGASARTWKATVRCRTTSGTAGPVTRTIKVRRAGSGRVNDVAGRLRVVRSGKVLRDDGSTPDTGSCQSGAQPDWPANTGPWWVLQKRPDITLDGEWLPAHQWDDWAARCFDVDFYGAPDKQAQVGDVAVWNSYVAGAGANGFVSYVEAVTVGPTGEQVVTVSEIGFTYVNDTESWPCGGATCRNLDRGRWVDASFIHGLRR